jgi:hypothetical protein
VNYKFTNHTKNGHGGHPSWIAENSQQIQRDRFFRKDSGESWGKQSVPIKDMWLYPLARDFRSTLTQ